MSFRRIAQGITLTLFIILLLLAKYPFQDGLAVDFFLRLDPLIGLGTMIASRTFVSWLVPGFVLLAATIFFGRFFCGHICPMGTTLDALESLTPRRKNSTKLNNYENSLGYRFIKYMILLFIGAAAVFGVSLIFLASPLSLITRLYGLVFHPFLLLLGEIGLELSSSWFVKLGLPDMAYIELAPRVFATNFFIFTFFVGIAALASIQPRFWCRNLCPAGALFALFSLSTLIKRHVNDSCTQCGRCARECPTGAICEDPKKYANAECITCLHCKNVCPESAVSFSFYNQKSHDNAAPDLTRRGILMGIGTGIVSAGLFHTNINHPKSLGKERSYIDPELIRPPGALPEPEFLTKCMRCGECMKACPTNTLQPTWFKAGIEGIFSPILIPRLAACAVKCNVCGKVCPTGAVRELPLIEKNHAKIGTAWISREICLVWREDKKCLVCDEVCPYGAVSFRPVSGLRNAAPFVVPSKCTGCGWCENKCPVNGVSAIRVNTIGELRLTTGSYVEKAQEYGFVFKQREKNLDKLAPGIFDSPEGMELMPHPDTPEFEDFALPPGFTVK